jgi:hypothetical protein
LGQTRKPIAVARIRVRPGNSQCCSFRIRPRMKAAGRWLESSLRMRGPQSFGQRHGWRCWDRETEHR